MKHQSVNLCAVAFCSVLLSACGGGSDSVSSGSAAASESPSQNLPPSSKVSIQLKEYSGISISDSNVKMVTSGLNEFLSYQAMSIYGLVEYSSKSNPSSFVFAGNNAESTSLNELCPGGGSLTVDLSGSRYQNGDWLELAAGASQKLTSTACGSVGFKSGYFTNGVVTKTVERGFYNGSFFSVDNAVVSVVNNKYGVYDGNNKSTYEYADGTIKYDYKNKDDIGVSYSNYRQKEIYKGSVYEFLLEDMGVNFALIDGNDYWNAKYTIKGTSDVFRLGLSKWNGFLHGSITKDLTFSYNDQAITSGEITLFGEQGVLIVTFHDTYVEYSLDSNNDDDFESSGTI